MDANDLFDPFVGSALAISVSVEEYVKKIQVVKTHPDAKFRVVVTVEPMTDYTHLGFIAEKLSPSGEWVEVASDSFAVNSYEVGKATISVLPH
jgi:hypothetical protein